MRRNWKDQFIIAEKWDHIVEVHHLPKEIPFIFLRIEISNDTAKGAAAALCRDAGTY